MINIKQIWKQLQSKDVQENIEKAIAEINTNIEDSSTHPTNKRSLKIVIAVSPDDQREQAEVSIDVLTTLARRVVAPRIVLVGKHESLPFHGESEGSLPLESKGKKGKKEKE